MARRGRPPGRTERGDLRREELFSVAVSLFGERGYDETSLRAIASVAGVSPSLLYKYFPDKISVVLTLYDKLSLSFAEEVPTQGTWGERVVEATRSSLATLHPHRRALRALLGVMVSPQDSGLFGTRTRESRKRVLGVFIEACEPLESRAEAMGRLTYLAHLGIIMVWLLDRSPDQRATTALLAWTSSVLPYASYVLVVPGAWPMVRGLDEILQDALMGVDEPTD